MMILMKSGEQKPLAIIVHQSRVICLCQSEQPLKIKQNLSQMAEQSLSFENTYLEDYEVSTENCCLSVVNSRSTKNIGSLKTPSIHLLKPSQKSKSNKQLKSRSLNLTTKTLNIPSLIKKTDGSVHQDKLKIHKITSIAQNSSTQVSPQKRIVIVKKCLDYKNRKILEHNLQEKSSQSMFFLTPKKEVSTSTSRNTPRDEFFTESQQSYLLKSCKFQEEDNFSRENQEHLEIPSYQKKTSEVQLKVSKSKKTLQNLYEKQSGRKIEIVQSQASQADLYSVVEDHDWHLNF